MSETLYVEGPDRETVLAHLRAEHGGPITVVSQERVRRGGVFGFYSRELVGITYQLSEEPAPAPAVAAAAAPAQDSSLADLIAQADSSDGPRSAAVDAAPVSGFAEVLAALAEASADAPAPPGVAPPVAPVAPTPLSTPPRPPVATHPDAPMRPDIAMGLEPVAPTLSPRTRLDMLAELREVGVPVPMTPETGETSLYRAIEQVIEQLPVAPLPPRRAGEILVLAGPIAVTRVIARELARQLHIPARAVWVAASAVTNKQTIYGPQTAAKRAVEMRTGDVPVIVVVDTDSSYPFDDDRPSWAAQVIAALQPDAVWAVVDATRKTADARADLDGLGPIDALAVHSASSTASPATVWDLEIPVALLDGRSASPGVWAALLFDRLRAPSGPARGRGA